MIKSYFCFFALLFNAILLPASIDTRSSVSLLVEYARVPGDDIRAIFKWLNKWHKGHKGQLRTELENERIFEGSLRVALTILFALWMIRLKWCGIGNGARNRQNAVSSLVMNVQEERLQAFYD